MNEIEARKARAVALLSAWLHEGDPTPGLVAEIREAVAHLIECNGWQCIRWEHKHREDRPVTEKDKCAAPCADCEAHREGWQGSVYSQRPVLDLLDELATRLERREEMAS